jgi:transcriptional regulator with XRE-family HTH domain
VAEAVTLARGITGMSRLQASTRAGIARSTWERIEAGDPGVSLKLLVAAADAVGVDLVLGTYPGREPSLKDSGQLAFAKALATAAHPSWRMSLEEPGGDHGEAIDQVFWGVSEIIAVEIETLLADWQGQTRRHELKRDWLSARHARPVRLVTLVADRSRNRAAMTPFAPLIAATRPAGSRAVLHAIRTGQSLGRDGICWMRRPWRVPNRSGNRGPL